MRNKEDWEILYVLATNEGMKKNSIPKQGVKEIE